jgi:predicted DCC family thiol-disulfide oxidoreductase YuxK
MAVLIFDGDCGFCTTSVTFARRWINRDVDAIPWQQADLHALGLTQQDCEEAVQYRDDHGQWSSGGAAVVALLRDARPPWRWLGGLLAQRFIAGGVERVYRLVANNRHRLPGGTPACQAPQARS